ncbi:MAG: peptidoglycan DD-metalloendopeptidase family protein [Xanthomonadales bacterium]|nr:peptidoglycan DD-metalloendopeptidase family protein [Xanthomonadales bacterium]
MTRTRKALTTQTWLILTVGLLFLIFNWNLGFAETDKQKKTRQQIEQLAEHIQDLQQELEGSRSLFGDEQQALKQLDLEIQSNRHDLRMFQQQALEQQQQIVELEQNQQQILAELGLEKHQLAQQLRQAWLLGRGSQLKLLLNQDDLSQGSRMMTYYRYFNQSRLSLISEFDQQLDILEENYRQLQIAEQVLTGLQADAESILISLENKRQLRQQSITALNHQIETKSSRLVELKQDRKDLETLLERLQDLLGDIPEDLGAELSLQTVKGQLAKPLDGRVRYRFGDQRSGNIRWKGWFFQASTGTDVHTIANGRIAYADWLRGYGLLMIIDHGDGFMSLYSYNESLFKSVGEWVGNGEVIAQSGPASGTSYDGLYFELRHEGKALNPQSWFQK